MAFFFLGFVHSPGGWSNAKAFIMPSIHSNSELSLGIKVCCPRLCKLPHGSNIMRPLLAVPDAILWPSVPCLFMPGCTSGRWQLLPTGLLIDLENVAADYIAAMLGMPRNNKHSGVQNSILDQWIDNVMEKTTNLDDGTTVMNDAMTVGDCVPLHAASVTTIGSELANVRAICSHKLQLDM